jgi:DNA-directed RNA polymerase specialized sigma24 family protein
MDQAEPETEQLLTRAAQGDQTALGQLLGLHRQRLRQMIALRLDRQVQARLDPSDVVQETLAEASYDRFFEAIAYWHLGEHDSAETQRPERNHRFG